MKDDKVRETILDVFIKATEAQLRALRRLKGKKGAQEPRVKRTSHLDMVEDILIESGSPLHVLEIIRRVRSRHGVQLDRESIVSSLAKKVHRGQRFRRPAPNTFALLDKEEKS